MQVHRAPSSRISRAVDARQRPSRDGTAACPGSPATNLLAGRNSTVIPNNYLQLGQEAKAFLHTRVRARRLLSGYTWPGPAGEGPAEFGPACISSAGRSALIRHHSLAHRHVHASLSVQSSSEISVIPSNDFSPFVLRGRAQGPTHAPGGTRWPGQNLSLSPPRLVDDYILRESLSIINARKSCTYAQGSYAIHVYISNLQSFTIQRKTSPPIVISIRLGLENSLYSKSYMVEFFCNIILDTFFDTKKLTWYLRVQSFGYDLWFSINDRMIS